MLGAYLMHEATYALFRPLRLFAKGTRAVFDDTENPFARTPYGTAVIGFCDMLERITRRYGKPAFNITSTEINGQKISVRERIVWQKPFCSLLHFSRGRKDDKFDHPKMLIVAPLSSHYATLLRHTVECLLPTHDIYITDWIDSRTIPVSEGPFDLDDYIDYIIEILHLLGPNIHVLAVCQPAVPVAAATALMEAQNDPCHPASMILIGGPVDASKSPTEVNKFVHSRGVPWFQANCVMHVPFTYAGSMREVIPGFFQLSGFMAMNLERHVESHWTMFTHLLEGSGDSAEKQIAFYDEYLAVMDLPAEYFLQTVQCVFVDYALARGTMKHRDIPVDLKKISRTALMTIEGERDDISGIGQTYAAQDLCSSIPKHLKRDYLQLGVGHYGLFSGSRFKNEIVPQIVDFTSMVTRHLLKKE